jgi:hypothetical protein
MDHTEWVVMENVYLSLDRVLNTRWEFQCPTHGIQNEKPLQAEERSETPKGVGCSTEHCPNAPIGAVEGRPFCHDHFIITCQTRLDHYYARMRERRWREVSLEAVSRFIQAAMKEADRIGLDKVERARLLNVILSAAELARHLRRSPRKALAIPVRLLSEDPRALWEEDTETVTVSRCGALVRSQHSAEIDHQLKVQRPSEGTEAKARVAWRPPERESNPVLAVEFINSDNFWGLDWNAIEAELMSQGDQPRAN